jgi:tight adherence protein B
VPALAILAAASVWQARKQDGLSFSPAALLVSLAADQRAGHTLRSALASWGSGTAVGDRPGMDEVARLAATGQPMGVVIDALARHLGGIAHIAAPVLAVAAESGGSVAEALESLADEAMVLDDIERERRAASMPGLLQAAVVGGVPVLSLGLMVGRGELAGRLAAGPVQAGVTVAGIVLVSIGVAVVVFLVVRGNR